MGPYRGYTRNLTSPQLKNAAPVSLDYLGDDAIIGKWRNELPQAVAIDTKKLGLQRISAAEAFDIPSLGDTIDVRNSGADGHKKGAISPSAFVYLVRRRPGLLYAMSGLEVAVYVRASPLRQIAREAIVREKSNVVQLFPKEVA